MIDQPTVVDNPSEHRFETTVDGHRAELVYRHHGNRLVLVHTGVPDEIEGHGLGGQLVRAAIDKAVENGWTVVPRCSFARRWLKEHPEEAARVLVDWPVPS